ncbi:MAG: hypothetical protein AAFQ82_05870 [Myxococcota bacterium]
MRNPFKRKPKQRTFVYCPACKNELVGDPKTELLVNDPENEVVEYRCGNCGAWSRWLFGAPVPIFLEGRTPAISAGGDDNE